MHDGETSCLTGRRVVVIDDNPDDLALMIFFLRRAGVTCSEAVDGRSGLGLVVDPRVDSPADAVVCDLEMPGIDGIETTRAIRDAGYDGPVIAVSGSANEAKFDEWLNSGCDTFLEKPLDGPGFVKVVTEAVERAGLRRGDREGV
ncbi:MAG: response regulator [Planctomycetota bacterium]